MVKSLVDIATKLSDKVKQLKNENTALKLQIQDLQAPMSRVPDPKHSVT
jgi:cell division protein FtsB